MTPRSPKIHSHPKTTTISHNTRHRADQNISAQSRGLPSSRIRRPLRVRRAAILPRHISSSNQTSETLSPSSVWHSSRTFENIAPSSNSRSEDSEGLQSRDLFFAQSAAFPVPDPAVQESWDVEPTLDQGQEEHQVLLPQGLNYLPSTLLSIPGDRGTSKFPTQSSKPPDNSTIHQLQDMR